jgi:transcriptional regulator with XRE-family HTH domain
MFADRLRAAMTERGWSAADLATRLEGIASRRTVYEWIAGERAPGLVALIALLDALGVERASAAAVAWQDDAARASAARVSDR